MKETLYSRRSNLVVGFHGCDQSIKEQVFEHLARLAAVADLSEENRIAYDKALDRYRVNQIVFDDEPYLCGSVVSGAWIHAGGQEPFF